MRIQWQNYNDVTVVELQGGVRGQWLDTSTTGDVGRMLSSQAQLGPFIALGLTF